MGSAERVVTPAPGSPDAHGVRGAVGGEAVPTRAEGVELLGDMRGSGYRQPPALVRRGDGQTITLTPLLYVLLKSIDGDRTCEDIAARLTAATGRGLSSDDVCFLIDKKLRPLGLLTSPAGDQPAYKRSNPLLALRLKVVLTDPTLTRRITAPFAALFTPILCLPLLAAFASVTWWLFMEEGLASAIHGTFYDPVMVLVVWGLVLASAGFHEFGHAAACRYGGAQPGAMGAGLYLVWPAFYTDVTDSYRLGKAGRLRVDLGGLYFNAIFALLTMVAWRFYDQDALLLVVGAQHLQMIKQLAPFIRADGYHIVADLTGVPDLFAHIKPTLASVLPRRFRPTAPSALKPWARAVVILWVVMVVPLLGLLLTAAVLLLPRLLATAWDSVLIQWDAVGQYWSEGDLAGVLVRCLSAVIVALPALALVYLLWRIGRGVVRWAWRVTEGKKLRRLGMLAVLAGVVAALVWAWWPRDDSYRPIAEDEQIDIPTFVPAEQPVSPAVVPTATAVPPAARVGVQVLPLSSWVPVYVPQAPSVLPLVQALHEIPDATLDLDEPVAPGTEPATDTGTEWPFPFPGPDAPRKGDNLALAINTTDGTVVTDLAVAWAIATAEEITTRNEAWALASCTDCAARAVAFQALLIVGEVPAIAPVNAAVAANYECRTCVTEALAVQLVVSVTGMPSDQAQSEIGAAMRQVKKLEKNINELTLGQILYVIQATEAKIMDILDRDGKLPDLLYTEEPDSSVETADGEETSTPAGSETPGPETPTGTETQTDTATETATGTPTDDGSATTSPSGSPSTTPTSASPTTSPSTSPTSTSSGSTTPTPSPTPTTSPSTTTSPSPSSTP